LKDYEQIQNKAKSEEESNEQKSNPEQKNNYFSGKGVAYGKQCNYIYFQKLFT
jgi:hypothetical protein